MDGASSPLPAPAGRTPVNRWLEEGMSGIEGRGMFARCRIPAGTRVIEYTGERIDKAESNRRCSADNRYIFALDDRWDLDGSVDWNPARFINHSCDPNCEAVQDGQRIWIDARREIAPGEEVTFNYGYDLEDYRAHPCRCGVSACVGYMVAEEHFAHVRRQADLTLRGGTAEVPSDQAGA